MKFLWDLFEISVNCFQGFVMMYFPFKFLGGKFSDKFTKNHGALFAVLYAVLISILNLISVFEHFLAILYVLLIFLFCITCLHGKIIHKLFASVFPVVIALIVSALIASGTAVLFNKTLNEVFISNGFHRLISVVTAQLLILYLIMLSLKIIQKDNYSSRQLSHNEWALIIVTLLLSIVIGALLVLISFDSHSPRGMTYSLIGMVALIIINIVTFYFIIDLSKKNIAVIENEKLKIQAAYNEQYIENADTEYNLIRKLRHDNKAMYQVLDDFLSKGEIDKARKHLKKMTDIADDRLIFVKTDNDFANSIINAKLTMAKSFGIQAVCMTVNNFTGIDDIDLCRLLSNMLDNAITATSALDKSEKKLSVNISEDLGTYTFLICNSIEKSVLKNNPKLLSTKKNKDTSGLGTKIIRDIADKYNGKCDFYEKDKLFCCSVIINTDI